jgi:hypothetical protein
LHADTSVAGANCILIEETGRCVNVSSFHGSARKFLSVPIATVGTLYEDRDGHHMILIIHDAL